MVRQVLPFAALAAVPLLTPPTALAQPPVLPPASPPAYAAVGQFPLPSGAFDFLPDGSILQIRGSELFRQTSPGAATFVPAGRLPAGEINSFGASFLRISPSGLVAIGDGNFGADTGPGAPQIHLFSAAALDPAATLATTTITGNNFDAAWGDDGALYVAAAASPTFTPYVVRYDPLTPTAARTDLITAIGDGSGGVALRGGRLFTGIGFDFNGNARTGQVRAFDLASLGTQPVSFAAGTLVADALSAFPLGFDGLGNLLVGGNNGAGDRGYAAVISAAAIDRALAGGPIADGASPDTLRLFPGGSGLTYSIRFNPATSETLVIGGGVAYRYTIPTPHAAALLAGATLFAWRRRRA